MGRHGNVICILRPTPQQRKYVHRRSYGHELSLITNSISGPHNVAVEPVAANFDDGVKTFSISKSHVMKQLLQLGETISYK